MFRNASAKIYHPAENPASKEHGILLFNHAGSVVSQDTGRDAQILARRFKLPVLAVNRPGSGYELANPVTQRRLGRDYIRVMQTLHDPIAEMCASNGIKRLIVTGRSAAGTGAVAFAAGGEMRGVKYDAVYTAEMAGCGKAGNNTRPERRAAKHEYANYPALQSDRQSFDKETIKPEKTDVRGLAYLSRLASMAVCNINDIYNHNRVWGSRVGIDSAKILAAEAPDTLLDFEFAQLSAAADQSVIESLEPELRALRSSSATAPVNVYQPPHTTHASFDNRNYFAERFELTYNYVLSS